MPKSIRKRNYNKKKSLRKKRKLTTRSKKNLRGGAAANNSNSNSNNNSNTYPRPSWDFAPCSRREDYGYPENYLTPPDRTKPECVTKINDNLYLGSSNLVKRRDGNPILEWFERLNINFIVGAAGRLTNVISESWGDKKIIIKNIADMRNNYVTMFKFFDDVYNKYKESKENGMSTLVYCNAGQDRSVLTVCSILIHEGYTVDEAIEHLKKTRGPEISAGHHLEENKKTVELYLQYLIDTRLIFN